MSTEPRLLGSIPVQRRVRIPRPAAAELAARYRARAEAERRLVDFLAGITLAKGLAIEEVAGFDDVTAELILAEPTP
jgi:hypothetical protein